VIRWSFPQDLRFGIKGFALNIACKFLLCLLNIKFLCWCAQNSQCLKLALDEYKQWKP
jgi:hypothetical protein